ncbi:fungal-specific transcription factor domain-containing protein [Phaeosphaeria sp. MPI-PUGE-AT-0046c]|nr:fungal-specific transcription factor domain-containing protein [Phaeosphaeria sp. MPI-PUGE-AT-0046c]
MEDADDMDVAHDGSTSKRACDSCRTRKIRCDRIVPCSNCKASKLSCTTTAPTQKTQRQRVHISEEYEKKIDRIEDRLAGIESVLANLATKLSDLDLHRDSTERSSQSRSSRKGVGRSPSTFDEAPTPAPFEGETTIRNQSGYARELLAKAVGSTPSIEQNAEVKSALAALGDLVAHQGNTSASTKNSMNPLINRSLADIDPAKLDKPPWEVINEILRIACDRPPMSTSIVLPFLKMRGLRSIVEDAYTNPTQCGATRRMLAYGILHVILTELTTIPPPGMNAEDNRVYGAQCKFQIEVAMSQLDIFMPATYENIMAAMLGGSWGVEMCRPSLTSVMIGIAAGMCQALGYHRYQTMKDDTEEERNEKIHLFWMIYMFDKTMSLRLGRPSVIQDWDISLPFFTADTLEKDVPAGRLMLTYWVKVARVQGQTYERLFSPAAFLKPGEERTRTAVELVNALNQAWYERGDARITDLNVTDHSLSNSRQLHNVKNSDPNNTDPPSMRRRLEDRGFHVGLEYTDAMALVEDIFFYADTVMHYSTCSLIQRAVSPDNVTFNQECLESARAALVAHMRCSARFNVMGGEELWNGYVHWSILQAPFTPFIVIFCNIIQNLDDVDLPSLNNFASSLESCRTLSEGADKLYKMCRLFCQVAKLYLQAKTQDNTAQSQAYMRDQSNYYTSSNGAQFDVSNMTDFDPYLSALGLMPNSTWPMTNFSGPQNTEVLDAYSQPAPGLDLSGMGLPDGGQNSLQDWFSGSRYLINLMENTEDLQMPDLDF